MGMHVMLDIETLGKGNYAAIRSIGAVLFDPNNLPATADELRMKTLRFHARVKTSSNALIGLRMDGDTVDFWLNPKLAEANAQIMAMEEEDLHNVLSGFREWFGDPKPVWGNGAMFDNVIMTNAFTLSNIPCPWTYRDDRCYRTLKNLVLACKPVDYGTAHSAIDDAMAQVWHLQHIVKHLGLTL